MKQIIVIGGGSSGMMAAISSKMHNPEAKVTLLERNARLGTKLRMTGGGRCNVTANVDIDTVVENVPKNGKFLYSTLSGFGPVQIQEFFKSQGCELKEEDHGRMFPASNRSVSIVETLEATMRKLGVEIKLEAFVDGINAELKEVSVNGKTMSYDGLIVATGSKTLPGTGSDGNGYTLMEMTGHTITELLPAEVPLVSNDQFIQDKVLQGLSFRDVKVSAYKGNKIKHSITHDLLFAHFGISGPSALRISFTVQKLLEKEDVVTLGIDFLPTISHETLSQQEKVSEYCQELGLPKRLMAFLEERSANKNEFISNVKNFKMTVYDTRGFKHAFVTNGGVSVKEINPKTLKSKHHNSIAVVGELLDYNAYTGGYNITSAFSTGFTAGKNILLSEETV